MMGWGGCWCLWDGWCTLKDEVEDLGLFGELFIELLLEV